MHECLNTLSQLQAAQLVNEAITAGSITSKQLEKQSLLAPLLSGGCDGNYST